MQEKHYQVKLSGYTYIKIAFSEEQAIILAQAEAIQNGRNYKFESILKFDV